MILLQDPTYGNFSNPTGRFRQAKVEDPSAMYTTLKLMPYGHLRALVMLHWWKKKKKKRSAASHNALPCEQHRELADTSREHAQHWALTAPHGVAHLITQLHEGSSLCKLLPPSDGSTSHIRVVLSNRPCPSSSLFHF